MDSTWMELPIVESCNLVKCMIRIIILSSSIKVTEQSSYRYMNQKMMILMIVIKIKHQLNKDNTEESFKVQSTTKMEIL